MRAPPPPAHDAASADDAIYPVSDDMGQSGLQLFVMRVLIDLLEDYFAALGRPVLVGGNQFFYFQRGEPRAVVAPDVYVVDDEVLRPWEVKSWKTWEHAGKAPTFALEIVSDEYRKDYSDQLIDRYQRLGVHELVRYDPRPATRATREVFAHFVREGEALVRRPTPGDRVHLASWDLWLVRHLHDALRLGVGPGGGSLWPTAREARDEEARARAVEARARDEAEARARAEAEAEAERLRAELAALRRLTPRR